MTGAIVIAIAALVPGHHSGHADANYRHGRAYRRRVPAGVTCLRTRRRLLTCSALSHASRESAAGQVTAARTSGLSRSGNPFSVAGMRFASRAAAAAAAAAIASFTYQTIAETRDRHRFPPPGRLVNIGGRRLHLMTAGEGSPPVVIIPALGEPVLGWLHILQGAAAETRACVYSRAEIGWSDPPPHWQRTPDLMAADLYALLCAAGITPPYILVGHSMGGVVARWFYVQHPGLVAGMLLVDSSHEQQAERFAALGWWRGRVLYLRVAMQRQARVLGVLRLMASAGLVRGLDAEIAREAPPEYAGAYRAILLSSRERRVAVREWLMMAFMTGAPPGLDSIPLTVLTRAASTRWDWPVWAQLQHELAALSSDSEHIRAQEAGHYVHLDEPALVIGAIRDLVRRCR